MTGSLFLDLLISVGGVALLIALSWLLGGLRSVRVDETAATERLAFDEPDFAPADWLTSADGCAAAAISRDGRDAAVVFAVGDRLATRRFKAGAVAVHVDGRSVAVLLGDVSRPKIALLAPDADAANRWARRLRGEGA
jgi:hypothetical protein